ncbi:MarR family winged helix-turn-helix transcriptional regulator [Gracilibacillus alcaliphilus]|uniref:MarR family winged helix-turn-helix transcriptional regulator n=1 Tax=Gracilibacillus alcaliphilus TaxID=1401441 RepID=UPI00195BAF90|nr:MarR family transcriptional regulator [Gracilibacillus alcaliphilus]MBM7676801.1 DNA-binding MarR family transcriptional regulator [Gracilibacillus alcaliphilus]
MLENYLKECLYFTANRLGRIITKMAEDEFAISGLSPTYAYLLMVVYDKEGVSQKELSEILHLKPSTVTRLVEKLISKGLIYSQAEGRMSLIYTTEKGKSLQPTIHECWMNLRRKYSEILGEKEGEELTLRLDKVSDQLENKE